MSTYTFLLTETAKILPKDRVEELGIGVFVTIISRRDVTGGPLTAQGIVIHPKVDEEITPLNEITLSSDTVAEDIEIGELVGTFMPADPTTTDTYTYELVPGTGDTDNALFEIVGNELRTLAALDFDTKSSYSIRVRITDQNGLWIEKIFIITVTNVNEAPTDITLSASTLVENLPIDTEVGIFTTIDPDLGDNFTYELVVGDGDTDNALFTIVGDSLRTLVEFDVETDTEYSIRVLSKDQGDLTFEKVFVITVTSVVTP